MDMPATVTSKGQITLPKDLRDALGLKAGDKVLFRVHKDKAVLAKVPSFLNLGAASLYQPGKRERLGRGSDLRPGRSGQSSAVERSSRYECRDQASDRQPANSSPEGYCVSASSRGADSR